MKSHHLWDALYGHRNLDAFRNKKSTWDLFHSLVFAPLIQINSPFNTYHTLFVQVLHGHQHVHAAS